MDEPSANPSHPTANKKINIHQGRSIKVKRQVQLCMRFTQINLREKFASSTCTLANSIHIKLYTFCRRKCRCKSTLRLFSTKRNISRRAEFFFVFPELVVLESSHTKKNSAPRGIFRLVENSLRSV